MSHPMRIFLSPCGVSMLEIQRARTLAVEVYKSIYQMTPIYIQEMFNTKVTPYDRRDPCRTVIPKAKTTPHGLNSLTSGTLYRYILKGQ